MNATGEIAVQKTREQVKANLQKRHLTEKLAFGALWLNAGAVILVLFFVIFYLLIQGGKFFIGEEPLMEDVALVDSNDEMRDEIVATPYSIGYLSFGYLDDATKTLRLNDIEPTVANVESGAYPVIRTLYLLTPGKPEGKSKFVLDYIQSVSGQQLIAEQGYVPLETVDSFVEEAGVDFTGALTVSGSTTVLPLMQRFAEVFTARCPDLMFNIEGGGSTSGIKAAGRGNVDIGMSSRDIKGHELRRYDGMQAFPIAHDGIAIVAHPDIPLESLTINQVRDIFTGNITNWSEVGGPDGEIVVMSRKTDSGTWNGFEKWILSKDLLISKGFETGNFGLVFQNIWASMKFVWGFLTKEPLPGMGGLGGISTTITTTIYLVFWTLVIATPLGVGAAIYLVEYAGEMGGQSGEEVPPPSWWRYAVMGGAVLFLAILVGGGLLGKLGLVVGWLLIFVLFAFLLFGVLYGEGVPKWWVFAALGAVLLVVGRFVPSVRMLSDIAGVMFALAGVLHFVGLLHPAVNVVGPNVVPVVRFAVETLAGVPSIIFGLFGFALFVTAMHLQLSMISGALAGACLILPTIIRTTEEALLTVPRSYREGSLALGATKWQTNWQVVLPAALPGIVTGIILGVGRIVSETAVFYVTLGGSIHPPRSLFALGDQGRTMVLHLYSLMMDANASDPAMGTAIVLIMTIIFINLAINYFSNRLSRSLSGKA